MRARRKDLVGGILLIVLGVALAALRLWPGAWDALAGEASWPLIVAAVGLGLLVVGLVGGEPGMAIPACVVMGIGGILYYQNATGDWESWSYAWALIPGFAGVGILLSSLLGGKEKAADGLRSILVSLLLFAIFGSAFGAFGFLGDYWPVLLIALGVVLLAQGLFQRKE